MVFVCLLWVGFQQLKVFDICSSRTCWKHVEFSSPLRSGSAGCDAPTAGITEPVFCNDPVTVTPVWHKEAGSTERGIFTQVWTLMQTSSLQLSSRWVHFCDYVNMFHSYYVGSEFIFSTDQQFLSDCKIQIKLVDADLRWRWIFFLHHTSSSFRSLTSLCHVPSQQFNRLSSLLVCTIYIRIKYKAFLLL